MAGKIDTSKPDTQSCVRVQQRLPAAAQTDQIADPTTCGDKYCAVPGTQSHGQTSKLPASGRTPGTLIDFLASMRPPRWCDDAEQTLTPAEVATLDALIKDFPDLERSLRHLAELAGPSGAPLLRDRGVAGTGPTVLEALSSLARTRRFGEFPNWTDSRGVALAHLVSELASPFAEINQGDRGTCSATALSAALAIEHPGEYARLMVELLTNGQTTLANGDAIAVPKEARAYDKSDRSTGERVLQSALMTYARRGSDSGAPDRVYRNTRPEDEDAKDSELPRTKGGYPDGQLGLQMDELERLARGLFNAPLRSQSYSLFGSSRKELTQQLATAATRGNGGSVPAFVVVEGDLDKRLFDSPRPHVVQVVAVEGDTFYLRDPRGPYERDDPYRVKPTGSGWGDGGAATVHDADLALVRISRRELEQRLLGILTQGE